MLTRIRARITSAHLMAAAAIFIALGGTAIAVKKNSVGTKQLKENAVSAQKLKDGAVTTRKLADNAATGAKVDESTLETVPSAASATTATNATNAGSADSLGGRPLARVIPEVQSAETTTPNPLAAGFGNILTTTAAAVDAGPADIVGVAQMSFSGDDDDATAQCKMEIFIGGNFLPLGIPSMASVPPNATATAMTLAGHFNNAPSGSHPVRLQCLKVDINDAVVLDSASLVVTSIPE